MIDIHTIGAGGGSIAYIDQGGAFRVGPRSAGAVPGPAAYGRGGTEPTVTDANVVLGRLDKNDFLGGSMKLDEDAAHRVIDEARGRARHEQASTPPKACSPSSTATWQTPSARAPCRKASIRAISRWSLSAAPGRCTASKSPPCSASPEVIVPPYPGITSAMGLLTTDLKYDTIRTQFQVSGNVDLDRLNADIAAMESELQEAIRRRSPRMQRACRSSATVICAMLARATNSKFRFRRRHRRRRSSTIS